jgi:hypothetical protein
MKVGNVLTVTTLFVIMVVVALHAQPPEIEWSRFYGGDSTEIAYSVQQTTDGGYIFAGESNSFHGWHDSYFYLVKTDNMGNTLWSRTYGSVGTEVARAVQQTADGGYIIAGYSDSIIPGHQDFLLVKTDSIGNIMWEETYGGYWSDYAYSVDQTTDGGYIVAGWTNSFNGAQHKDSYLVKTDSIGNEIWSRYFGGTSYDEANSVKQTPDGEYIVVGQTRYYGGDYDIYLMRTNTVGDSIWFRTYGGAEWDYGFSMQQTNDGGYIIAGCTNSFGAGEYDLYLVKTDSMGNTLWTNTYGGGDPERAYSVQQTSDGGYILAGFSSSFSVGSDLYLVKTDSMGYALWELVYGDENSEFAYSIDITNDRGYIVAGYTTPSYYGNYECLLVKIAPDTFTYHPEIHVSHSFLDFETVPLTEDSSQEFTITNTGNAWLVLYDLTSTDSSFTTNFNPCDSLIAPGDSLIVLVTFAPGDTILYNDTLYIHNNDQSTEVLLTGIGIPGPEIVVSDSSLNFGMVAMREDSTQRLTIYSTGIVSLIIRSVTTSEHSFTTDFDPSDSLIAPGDSLEILVTFAPWDTVSYSETLTIDNNDELTEVTLLGIGLPPNAVVPEPPLKIPTTYSISSIYPNPFNTQTTIQYDVPVQGVVQVDVYDVLGREVAHLVDGVVPAGRFRVLWNAANLPSGIYFCRMHASDFDQIQKILLLK